MMKKILSALISVFIFSFSSVYSQEAKIKHVAAIEQFDLNVNTSVRAIAAVDDSTCWFAGNKGIFGSTEDGGKTWKIDSIKMDTLLPEFRAMAVLNKNTVLLSCIGSPAYILKTTDKGKTWRTVYTNKNPKIFFDAMKFRDEQTGIAVGDPIDSCFTIIKTIDGGETWLQINCNKIPKALEDEACFASSNTNIDFIVSNIWIATGGKYSRILKSNDGGASWQIFSTPVISGKQMTGTYTMDFFNSENGIIAGGNYDEKENASNNKAITNDGGKIWNIVANEKPPGFVSCVQYAPEGNGKIILASCLPGIFISDDNGKNWNCVDKDSKFYTFQFSPTGNTVWFAGSKGKLGKMKFRK